MYLVLRGVLAVYMMGESDGGSYRKPTKCMSLKCLSSKFPTQKNTRLKYLSTDLLSAFFPEITCCRKNVQMNNFVIH